MAHVIHSINVTVGGSCDHTEAVADEEHHRYALDLLTSADAVLFGRNTFDLFASFWPAAADKTDLPSCMTSFAAELNDKPKYVVSSRSPGTAWKSTTWLHGPELDEVTQFIERATGTVVIFGSPGLGTSLAAVGLVHEIHILVQPFVGATTRRAFAGLSIRKGLTLLEARSFRSGVVLLRYAT